MHLFLLWKLIFYPQCFCLVGIGYHKKTSSPIAATNAVPALKVKATDGANVCHKNPARRDAGNSVTPTTILYTPYAVPCRSWSTMSETSALAAPSVQP